MCAPNAANIEQLIAPWLPLSFAVNSLNRSRGTGRFLSQQAQLADAIAASQESEGGSIALHHRLYRTGEPGDRLASVERHRQVVLREAARLLRRLN